MSKKYVIVEGFAGLGNRFRTIAAAMDYCIRTGRSLSVDWSDGMFADKGMNAFDNFFEIYDFPSISSLDILADSFYPNTYQMEMLNDSISRYFRKKESANFIIRKSVNLFLSILGKCKFDSLCFWVASQWKYFEKRGPKAVGGGIENKIVFGGDLKENIAADAVIFVDNVPRYRKEFLREHVRLNSEMQKMVDDFVSEHNLGQNSLGIHIRATDKKFCGSLNHLLKKIDVFVTKKNINKVFLCTDSKSIEEILREHFKEKLITYPKYLPDSKQQGVHYWAMKEENSGYKDRMSREAVLDMFCLARTEYMLYQFGSTFSEISKIYHSDRKKCKSWRGFQLWGF